MKKIILLLITILLFGHLYCIRSQEFYILLGSGFRGDTISIIVNNKPLVKEVIVSSDSISGYSYDAELVFRNNEITLLRNGEITNTVTFHYDKNLKIILKINGRPYVLYADLRKGKYIVLSKHYYYFNVYLNQYKKPIIFE